MSASITSTWTRRFVAHVRAADLHLDGALADLGIASAVLDDPHGRVPFGAHVALVERIVERLGDPGLGVDVGAAAAAADFGVVGLLAESCSTLREALAAIQRFNALANEASLMDYWAEGDRAFIRDAHERDGRAMPAPIAEATLAFYATMIRSTSGAPLAEVWLAHERHGGWTRAREDHFGAPIRFGAAFHALVLPVTALDAPFVSARPELSLHLRRLAHHLEGDVAPLDDAPARVAAQVRRDLARGGPQPLHRAARALGTTPRTLQRQLEGAGQSYSDIVDAVRSEIASALLRGSSRTLLDVAQRAGYSDLRAFRRACLRWFGKPPAEYRRDHR